MTVKATDGYGNVATATFTVTVQDTTPPTIVAPNITLEATGPGGAIATYSPTITDAVGVATVTYTISSGSLFAIGTTNVTITATDRYGNVATKTFTVTIRDTTPPTITSIPTNIIATTSSSSGVVVTYAPATATDLVTLSPTITYNYPSGTKFPVGTTTVIVTATDAAGNKTTKTFTVTVVKH